MTYKKYDGGEGMRKRRVDILDLIPAEATEAVDKAGYTFLAKRGYDAMEAATSDEKRAALAEEMKRRGEVLRYAGAVDSEQGAILVWFELWRGRRRIARSVGLKLVQRRAENEK